MSNDIQTGKLPVASLHTGSQKTANLSGQAAQKSASSPEQPRSDKVSITDQVSRLQEIENMLGSVPPVNNALVAEVSDMIANGTLEMNLERTASRLIEMETGVSSPKDK
jgi:negative regulator of flagellin synthesis FlgM